MYFWPFVGFFADVIALKIVYVKSPKRVKNRYKKAQVKMVRIDGKVANVYPLLEEAVLSVIVA
jgi:hypothetical protein